MKVAVTTSTKTFLTSFEISYLIVKYKKPHAIGEILLPLAAIKMCAIMHVEKYGQAFKAVPLSGSTVMWWIESL
jgi:hypothetical protein